MKFYCNFVFFEMRNMKSYFNKKRSIVYDGQLIDLSSQMVMGILNVTPDSFFDGGKYNEGDVAIKRIEQMVAEGADIIDVGACSTRPGSKDVGVDVELERLLPLVKRIKQKYPQVLVSIDTYHSAVAKKVIEDCGCCIINDISGGTMDSNMFETIAGLKVPYVLMHIQGTPQNMQNNPTYGNVVKEVMLSLSEKVNRLHQLGVNDVIIDPGFGFGKTLDHNYELFRHLDDFRFFELPLLVGISRKSMIFRLFDIQPEDSLNGTSVLNTMALAKGADILRVHDVKEAVEARTLFQKVNSI